MKSIPEKGLSKAEIMKGLSAFRKGDHSLYDGRMFGHAFLVNDEVRRVAEEAFVMYLWENALDPGLFPSLMEMEREVVSMSASHLSGDSEVVGNFTSGGTESVLLAVKTARDRARAKRGVTEPEMVLPVTAHASFHKAAEYFCLKPVFIPVDRETLRADVAAAKKAVNENTALLVASAVAYAPGVVDPVPELAELAQSRDISLHVDGCIGAFVLPYFRELGVEFPDFDFRVPGVTSISMDFHKYGFAPKGASVILHRNREHRQYQIFASSKWTGYTIINPTVQSSRSGGALAATWAVMNYLGQEGYRQVAGDLYEATQEIIRAVDDMEDLYIIGRPETCILSVGSDTVDIFRLTDEMKSRGWHIQAQFRQGKEHKENFHLTVLPPNTGLISQWKKDLAESVEAVKKGPEEPMPAELLNALSGEDLANMDAQKLEGLFKMAGIEGGALPKSMAGINRILNSLPPETADKLFVYFYNVVSA